VAAPDLDGDRLHATGGLLALGSSGGRDRKHEHLYLGPIQPLQFSARHSCTTGFGLVRGTVSVLMHVGLQAAGSALACSSGRWTRHGGLQRWSWRSCAVGPWRWARRSCVVSPSWWAQRLVLDGGLSIRCSAARPVVGPGCLQPESRHEAQMVWSWGLAASRSRDAGVSFGRLVRPVLLCGSGEVGPASVTNRIWA
jgi:hypothetical protein